MEDRRWVSPIPRGLCRNWQRFRKNAARRRHRPVHADGDDEPRAEVYAAATDKDQAKILFRDAVAMVDQSAALSSRITRSGGKGKEWNLAYLATGSFFRPISSEHVGGRGKSGFRPHCALLDEVHEHPTSAMVEFMRAGTKGRRQALILMITNAGVYDPEAVAWHYHDYSQKILEQHIENDSFFSFVCSLDKGDSWTDPTVWRKTNPLLGIAISEKYLEEQVREAIGMPSKQSLVRRLNFCEWVEAIDPFVTPEVWRANGGTVPVESLVGRTCFGGLDLSGKNDLTSFELVFPLPEDSSKKPCPGCDGGGGGCIKCGGTGEVLLVPKAVLSFFWTPQDGIRDRADRDGAPYERWVKEGHLIAKPGATIDYGWVAHKLGELSKLYHFRAIAFDRYRIDDLKRELQDLGIAAFVHLQDQDNGGIMLIKIGQGYKDMSPAVEALEDDLKDRAMRHGNNPILGWCVANAKITMDPAGLRKFDKRKNTGRIDGAVALAMATVVEDYIPKETEPQFFSLEVTA